MTRFAVTVAGAALMLTAGTSAGPGMARSGGPATGAESVAAAAPAGSWTTYHRDDGRTGFDPTLPQVSAVSTGWVSPTLDDTVFAEPLVYGGLVYTATLGNTVYALDQVTGAVVWSKHLGSPETTGWQCGNVAPMGILGTPVIDAAAGRIYVAALFNDRVEGIDVYRVIGLSLASGALVFDTPISTAGFDWRVQQERGALAFHNGFVYVPFGGRLGDCGNYHGYVVGVPVGGGPQPVYQTPDVGSGIWGAGGPVVDDATGNVFATTGNGTGSGCSSVNQNDAVVRLNPTTLALQDYFMPQDWQADWCSNDEDLGSAGGLLISSSLFFQAGKRGGGFLLDPNRLGGVNGQLYPTAAGYTQAEVCLGNHNDATFGGFAYAAPFVYVSCEGHGLVALNVNTGAPSFTPCGSTCGAPDWQAGGTATFGPAIVAAGAAWVVDTGGGGLYVFDAATGTQIFHSATFSANRFVTPAEAGGQVFVPSDAVIREFDMSLGVSLIPSRLDFNGQAPNTTSASQTVTLLNQGTTLNVTAVAIAGANPAAYVKGTDTCTNTTVTTGGTCTVQISFRPPALGSFPASLTFTDSAPSSPQSVPLNGLGATDNQSRLYTLDRWGGLHNDGSAPALATSAYWPGWNIARGEVLFPDGLGGYVLDGWGGLHQFGNAAAAGGFTYWPGWDIARAVALAPWSSSASPAGWTLDGWGGVHAFGGAPAIGGFAYWPGWDIARGLVILPDSTPSSVAGYTMDGWGGLHPFGGAPAVSNFGYSPGWDIYHSLTVSPNSSKTNPAGWTLDGWGGVHPFGSAPTLSASAYWPGWDIARGIVAWTGSGPGGWVMDAWGGLHPFGAAPAVTPFAYWPGWKIAASLSGPPCGAGAGPAP